MVIHFGLDSMIFQEADNGVHSAGETSFASRIKTVWSALQDADVFFKPTIKKGLLLQIINCKTSSTTC